VLLQFSLPGSAYLPSVQHGLEFSCSHWFDDWYSLSFACGKEGVFVVFDEVVRNAIGGFERASLFDPEILMAVSSHSFELVKA
jgi:hypothetical protein